MRNRKEGKKRKLKRGNKEVERGWQEERMEDKEGERRKKIEGWR